MPVGDLQSSGPLVLPFCRLSIDFLYRGALCWFAGWLVVCCPSCIVTVYRRRYRGHTRRAPSRLEQSSPLTCGLSHCCPLYCYGIQPRPVVLTRLLEGPLRPRRPALTCPSNHWPDTLSLPGSLCSFTFQKYNRASLTNVLPSPQVLQLIGRCCCCCHCQHASLTSP
jgi:hypothetical protein